MAHRIPAFSGGRYKEADESPIGEWREGRHGKGGRGGAQSNRRIQKLESSLTTRAQGPPFCQCQTHAHGVGPSGGCLLSAHWNPLPRQGIFSPVDNLRVDSRQLRAPGFAAAAVDYSLSSTQIAGCKLCKEVFNFGAQKKVSAPARLVFAGWSPLERLNQAGNEENAGSARGER
jgi:hypothetical protein